MYSKAFPKYQPRYNLHTALYHSAIASTSSRASSTLHTVICHVKCCQAMLLLQCYNSMFTITHINMLVCIISGARIIPSPHQHNCNTTIQGSDHSDFTDNREYLDVSQSYLFSTF